MDDVAIIGGGPAGCALALRLRARGLRVVVVDRAAFPRDKPCGEGLLPTGVGVLAELGLASLTRELAAPPITALEFVLDGVAARGALPDAGAGLARVDFDAALARAARDAGAGWTCAEPEALVRDGRGAVRGVRLAHGRGAVEASVLVGADGLRSWTRRALGVATVAPAGAPRFGLCARVELDRPAGESVEIHIVPGVGELYVTPTGARRASLALLAPRASVTALGGRLEPAVRAAIARSPALARRLSGARLASLVTRATGPLASRAARPLAARAVLAGDAALAVDPIGGDGMTLALAGSAACADAVAALLAERAAPEQIAARYAAALRDLTLRRRAFVAALLGLARSPRAARVALAVLARSPAAVRALCAAHEQGVLRGLSAAV